LCKAGEGWDRNAMRHDVRGQRGGMRQEQCRPWFFPAQPLNAPLSHAGERGGLLRPLTVVVPCRAGGLCCWMRASGAARANQVCTALLCSLLRPLPAHKCWHRLEPGAGLGARGSPLPTGKASDGGEAFSRQRGPLAATRAEDNQHGADGGDGGARGDLLHAAALALEDGLAGGEGMGARAGRGRAGRAGVSGGVMRIRGGCTVRACASCTRLSLLLTRMPSPFLCSAAHLALLCQL
jgi:hypothetical protein